MHTEQEGRDSQELFDGRGEHVGPVFGERIKRVAQTCLSEDLERSAPHPAQHVELDCVLASARLDTLFDSIARLNKVISAISVLAEDMEGGREPRADVPCG